MSGWKGLANRLILMVGALGMMLGCSHTPVQSPVAFSGTEMPAARGQMADDIHRAPPLAIRDQPDRYQNAVAQAMPPNVYVPTAPPAPSDVHSLWQAASVHFASMHTYVARVHRREQQNGKPGPDEWQFFKWRQQPWSVYFKWIGAEHKGREVLYVHGQHGSQIHTLLAAGDMPLMPAGKHIALDPDNVFVRNASRHAITEAGIGNLVTKFGAIVAALEKDDRRLGTLTYRGKVRRPEYPAPMDGVEQMIPPGGETDMPKGGKRWWFFEATTHLPVLVITLDEAGHELEYNCYDQLRENVPLTDGDFNPDLWDRSGGH
jgi:hypothetical protein